MPDTAWKRHERRTAKALGGRRVGPTGKTGPDVLVGKPPWLCVQCKERRRLPDWLKDALAQARRDAGPGQLGVVALHERGRHDSLIVLSMTDFRDWFGGVGEGAEGASE